MIFKRKRKMYFASFLLYWGSDIIYSHVYLYILRADNFLLSLENVNTTNNLV